MTRGHFIRTVTTVLLALNLSWPASVAAEPSSPPGPPAIPAESAAPTTSAPSTITSWRRFGRPETLELRGANVETRVDLPMARGVIPTAVSGQIGSVVNITAGRIDVLDGRGTALGVIAVPVEKPTAPFTVDTSRAVVDDGILTLNFVLRSDDPPADTCAPTPSVALSRLGITLGGRPPDPTTVADFLPAYLDTIVIATGPTPSPDQQQAALALTAMLTRSYRPIPVRVVIDTSAVVPTGDPLRRRVITIRDSETSGIEVRGAGTPGAVLDISGRGPKLADQIALFIDSRVALAQSSSATVQSAADLLTPTSTLLTFEQLRITPSASFAGTATMYAGFDGAAFAVGPIERATVDLRARYTPTADDKASLLIKSGPHVLATQRLDATGILETEFDIPQQSIGSDIGMALELQYFPGGAGGCGPLNDRMTFTVDPQSTVEVTPGPAVTGGFTSLPMGFTPEFAVAVDRPELIRYAAQAINLIAQRTGTLLRPQITTWEEAAESGIPLLAVTRGESLSRFGMTPPVGLDRSGMMTVDGNADTGAVIDGPVGLVQSFTHGGRMVLAIDVPSRPELLDETFDYIRGLDGGWSSLSGDVVATGSAGNTVNLTIRSDRPVPGRRPSGDDGWRWSAVATAGVGIAAAVALIRGLVIRRRRAEE